MLFVAVTFLVLGQVFTELMLLYEVTTYEQLQGVVHRCPGYPVVVGLHMDVQRFRIEVVIPAINFLQDGVALRRSPGLTLFEVLRENILYALEVSGWIGLHGWRISVDS